MNAPWTTTQRFADAPRDLFAAFVSDPATAEVLKNTLLDMGWLPEKVHRGGLTNAVQTLSVSASPQILLVDLSECVDPLGDINALAEVCEPGTIVIAVGTINDVQLYRELLASGIHDYLLKPVSEQVMRDALHNAQAVLLAPRTEPAASEAQDVKTNTVAVIGARGGVGASTVATSLAWAASSSLGTRTALLDFDIHFGVGALSFDLEPGRGLTDALENPARIDSLFIERAIVKVNEKLAILSAEASISAPVLTDGAALEQLHTQVAQSCDAIVMDVPRLFAVQNPNILAPARHVVIVTDLTLAAARDTLRLIGFINTQAPNANIHLVANKVPPQGQTEVSRQDFEHSVERKLAAEVPFDPKSAIAAAQQGCPLAQAGRGSKAASVLVELAQQILQGDDAGESSGSPSLLGKLANLKSLFPLKSR